MTEGRRKTQDYSTLGEKIESVPRLEMTINQSHLPLSFFFFTFVFIIIYD